jgi:hypothetical protein
LPNTSGDILEAADASMLLSAETERQEDIIGRRLTRIDLIGLAILIALVVIANYFGWVHPRVVE